MSIYQLLWKCIEQRLDDRRPEWRNEIDRLGQVSAVKKREEGGQWSDNKVFESFVRSILSANTDWSKVEGVLPDLFTLLHDFSLSWYAALSPIDVERTLVPWFKQRGADSKLLGQNLRLLIKSAARLGDISQHYGSLESYLAHLSVQHNGDPKAVAAALGEERSPAKLPGFGVALAAESLKNVGYDVSKPDTHINRAMGSFGLVQFANWHDRKNFKTPLTGKYELRTVMQVMEKWALELSFPVTFLDNAVWLLCARGKVHLSNSDLAALRAQATHREDTNGMDKAGMRDETRIYSSAGVSDESEQGSRKESEVLSIPLALERAAKRLLAPYGKRIPWGKLVDGTMTLGNYKRTSILPTDYCYNRENPNSSRLRIFIWHPGGKYEYVGSNFKYSGPIIREPRKRGN
jgi:endonuclease III